MHSDSELRQTKNAVTAGLMLHCRNFRFSTDLPDPPLAEIGKIIDALSLRAEETATAFIWLFRGELNQTGVLLVPAM